MINKTALDLIKEFEGFRASAYKDPVGIWTIGYGTTAAAGVGIVPVAGMKITEAQASGYLDAAVTKFAHQVTSKIKRPITPNQFGAFVSLAYNIGPGAFAKSSALRKFNAGDIQGAADAILMWNKAGGKVMNGLVRRRQAERALFLKTSIPGAPESAAVAPTSKPFVVVKPPVKYVKTIIALIGATLAALASWFVKV